MLACHAKPKRRALHECRLWFTLDQHVGQQKAVRSRTMASKTVYGLAGEDQSVDFFSDFLGKFGDK